ncbi:MAG: alpha/beta fold hydrolase [Pseudomonadota bacterium]
MGDQLRLNIPDFEPRAPWWSGDLQTVRNTFIGANADLSPWPEKRREFVSGGGDDDRLAGRYQDPAEMGADHACASTRQWTAQQTASRPLVILVHGLTGSADSLYLTHTAKELLTHGFRVMRLSLRGSPPVAEYCTKQYHAGLTADLVAVVDQLPSGWVKSGVIFIGFSLGGNMVMRLAGEGLLGDRLHGVASVSAPLDLKGCQRRIMRPRNWLYHRHILKLMVEGAAANALPHQLRQRLPGLKTVYEFDDQIVAALHGFEGADDYYARNSAEGVVRDIACPTLIIHSWDDPWIDPGVYKRLRGDLPGHHHLVMSDGGGHLGFHVRGLETTWHDHILTQFCLGTLA